MQLNRALMQRISAQPIVGMWHWLATVVLIAAIALGTGLGSRTPASKDPTAFPEEFSAEAAKSLLQQIEGSGEPHPLGSAEHDRVRDLLVAELQSYGYTAEIQSTQVCGTRWDSCADVENILARLNGERTDQAVLVTAHYDSVPAGPGISDDANGVAIILQIAEALQKEKMPRNSVIFLISDAEEVGMLGAEAFAKQHPWSATVRAVLNMEARGTTGQSLMFETTPNNGELITALAEAAPYPVANSAMYEIYQRMPNDSDLSVHKLYSPRGMNFAFVGNPLHYHTPVDSVAQISMGSLQQQGSNVMALTRRFANADLSADPSGGNQIYFNLFGRFFIHYPAGYALPLALIALFLAGVGLLGLRKRGWLTSWSQFGFGLLAWPLAVAAGSAAAYGAIKLVNPVLGLGGEIGWTSPWAAVFVTSAGLVVAGLATAALSRKAGGYGIWVGALVWWNLLSVALAVAIPGLSYLFVWPALGSSIGLIVAIGLPSQSIWRWWCGLAIGIAPTALLWVRMFSLLTLLQGGLQVVLAVVAALIFTLVAPIIGFSATSKGRRWAFPSVAMIGTAAAVFMMQLSPGFTLAQPGHAPITYYFDGDKETSSWLLPKGNAPAEMVAAVGEPRTTSPYDDFSAWPAPGVPGTEVPQVTLLAERQTSEGNRELTLHITTPSKPFQLKLRLSDRPLNMKVNGEQTAKPCYTFVGKMAGKVDIAVVMPGSGSVAVRATAEWLELPRAGDALVAARPDDYVTVQTGDIRKTTKSYRF